MAHYTAKDLQSFLAGITSGTPGAPVGGVPPAGDGPFAHELYGGIGAFGAGSPEEDYYEFLRHYGDQTGDSGTGVLGGNEYTPYNNPSSLPGTWENWSGALGNLFAFTGPFGIAKLVAGILRGDKFGRGAPVGLSWLGSGEAEDPREEWERKSRLVSRKILSAARADAPGDPEVFPGRPSRQQLEQTVDEQGRPGGPPFVPQLGMKPVTVKTLAAPPPFLPLAFGGKELPYRPILEPVVFPAEPGEFFTPERQRQENVARAQAGDWDAGGGDDPGDWDEGAEGDRPEDDPTDYGYASFNTGGPVIKRRGSRDTATSPLAAGSFVDRPLYDRARAQYKVNF